MKQSSLLFRVLSLCALAGILSACVNLFDPIDNPSGDRQILSAARAAFDKGDIAEARELYGKISSNQSAVAETIFLDLDACGADIGAFGSALSNGTSNAGAILTIMGEKMAPLHGTACLATLLSAYKRSLNITDSNLKGFVGFLASIAIAGEVMAHNTGAQDGSLTKADYVVVSNCTGAACTGGATSCEVSDGISAQATVTLDANTASITATWGTVQGAFSAANTALGLMGISSGPSFSLITNGALAAAPASNDTYRCALNALGVGR